MQKRTGHVLETSHPIIHPRVWIRYQTNSIIQQNHSKCGDLKIDSLYLSSVLTKDRTITIFEKTLHAMGCQESQATKSLRFEKFVSCCFPLKNPFFSWQNDAKCVESKNVSPNQPNRFFCANSPCASVDCDFFDLWISLWRSHHLPEF